MIQKNLPIREVSWVMTFVFLQSLLLEHAHTHTHMHLQTHTHTHKHTHAHIYTRSSIQIHTFTHTHLHTHLQTHKHIYTHTHAHLHTNTTHVSCVTDNRILRVNDSAERSLRVGIVQRRKLTRLSWIT